MAVWRQQEEWATTSKSLETKYFLVMIQQFLNIIIRVVSLTNSMLWYQATVK